MVYLCYKNKFIKYVELLLRYDIENKNQSSFGPSF